MSGYDNRHRTGRNSPSRLGRNQGGNDQNEQKSRNAPAEHNSPPERVTGTFKLLKTHIGIISMRIFNAFLSVFLLLVISVFSWIYDRAQKNQSPVEPIQNPILLKSATALARSIRERKLTSVQVVEAFVEQIQRENGKLNAVVDLRIEDALREAAEVDKMLYLGQISKEAAEKTKPFLGVPFTSKESTSCKGMSFTMGLVARIGMKAEEDADVVKRLKEAGGILLGVTNIPELNMWCETRCIVFGQTNNPYNLTRTAGGSSGGEASILAACGSPMGIGTDIGGSIRMPAFYCGIFGHKPTTGLTPLKGLSFRTGAEEDSMVCAGPMSKRAEDMKPLLKVLIGEKVNLLELDSEVNISDIRITYATESGDPRTSSVTKETRDALEKAVCHLETLVGFPAEQLKLEGFKSSVRLWRHFMSKERSDFARDITNRTGRAKIWKEVPLLILGMSKHTLPAIMKVGDSLLPAENAEWAEEIKERLQNELLEKMGRNGVFIFPSHPFPADYHYTSILRPYNFTYWGIFNILRFPVTQVPLGLSSDGLPLGVQVVAAPYKDHLCLAVAQELERKFGGWVAPSYRASREQ